MMVRKQYGGVSLWLLIVVVGFVLYYFLSRGLSEPVSIERNTKSPSVFSLGIVWPSAARDLFVEGALLAVEEVNKKGGLAGLKIEPLVHDETYDFDTAMRATDSLAKNPSVLAVIGHSDDSNASIAASVVYQSNDILFISPGTSSRLFVLHDFTNIFQTIADDYEVGGFLAKTCQEKGFQKVALVVERLLGGRSLGYGESLAHAFLANAADKDIEIVTYRSFSPQKENYVDLVNEIKASEAEAVVMASLWPPVVQFLEQAQRLGLNLPVLAGDRVENTEILASKLPNIKSLLIASQGGEMSRGGPWTEFRAKFYKRWGVEPTSWAGKAYDAVWLLHRGVSISGELDTTKIAAVIRSTDDWVGVEGKYSFTPEGDLAEGALQLKKVENRHWTTVSKDEFRASLKRKD